LRDRVGEKVSQRKRNAILLLGAQGMEINYKNDQKCDSKLFLFFSRTSLLPFKQIAAAPKRH
jgi:hypothetical protein